MWVGMFALVVLIALILALPFLLDLNRYRDQYLPVLERLLQRTVTLGDVRLHLFPSLSLHVQDIRIADDPSLSDQPFLVVPDAEIIVSWKPLWERRIQVENVLIHDPQIHVIRSQSGVLNTTSIGRISTAALASSSNRKPVLEVNPLWGVLAVENLAISGGVVTFEDRQVEATSIYQLEDVNLTTEAVQWGKTATIQVEGRLSPGQVPVAFRGQVGPLDPSFEIPIIDVAGNVGQVTWSAKGALARGILDMDVQVPHLVTDQISWAVELQKPLQLSDLLTHVTLPVLPSSGESKTADIRFRGFQANLHLGNALVQVQGEGTPATFHVQGNAATLSTQDLPIIVPFVQPVVVEYPEVHATIQGKQLELSAFRGNVFQGTVEGKGLWIDSGALPILASQGTWKGFAVEQLQSVTFPSRVVMTGVGALNWDIRASMSGSSSLQWSGPATLTIGPGQLTGVDLTGMLEDALKMPGLFGATTPGATKFTKVQVKGEGRSQGWQVTQAEVQSADFVLHGRGLVGWDQQVQIQGEFFFPPKIADAIIHRFPVANVAKNGGQLQIPFVVQGTVQAPVLSLNTESLGRQIQQRVNQAIEKALRGDEKDMQELLNQGRDLLRQFFGP